MTPDYTSYTEQELIEARDTLDKNIYPGRYKAIISRLEQIAQSPEKKNIKAKENLKEIEKVKKFEQYYNFLHNKIIFLETFSFLFGILVLTTLLFNVNTGIGEITLSYNYPWLDQSTKGILFGKVMFIIIFGSMIIGFIGRFIKNETLSELQIMAWGLLAFGFTVFGFSWGANLNFDRSFTINFGDIGGKVNLISLFFFHWLILGNERLRKSMFNL